jgi:hypothetical protein
MAAAPLVRLPRFLPDGTQNPTTADPASQSCWLDVCAPFVVEDIGKGIHTDIILTSDTFVGVRGHDDGADSTDYEVYLYDPAGRALGAGGVAKRLTVPAMRTTVIPARELIGGSGDFWGGMKIRIKPRGREPMPASDLFSSAFVRWQTKDSFDNVHANPDPLQWQRADSFYYSMPFPQLSQYVCTLALFNPYASRSTGEINLFDPAANKVLTKPYDLPAFSSLLLCLNTGARCNDPGTVFGSPLKKDQTGLAGTSGFLAVTNDSKSVKTFGYLLIRRAQGKLFSVEHPIHQDVFTPAKEVAPFEETGNFKAKNMLYSPMVFRGKRAGGITLESRCFLSTGLPIEQAMWFYPFITDTEGIIQWDGRKDEKLNSCLPATNLRNGVIRLEARQSCVLDFQQLALKENSAGGISLAVSPDTTHTLMKVEVRVPEWGAHAFTHFRPGLGAAHKYQKPKQRGGIATDYITTGARLERREQELIYDEVIGVLNIEGTPGSPVLEVFGPSGLVARFPLGAVPGFACRHYLLSEVATDLKQKGPLTLRLVDENATLLMSILHLDYLRRDIALDHGSDRFSTLLDYNCNSQRV